MKSIRILSIAALSVLAGCATSLAPSDNFNDWTSPTAYRPASEQRSAEVVKSEAPSALAQASQSDSIHP